MLRFTYLAILCGGVKRHLIIDSNVVKKEKRYFIHIYTISSYGHFSRKLLDSISLMGNWCIDPRIRRDESHDVN